MSHIAKLKLSQITPMISALPPKERARAKALTYLTQLAAPVQGELSGEPYLRYRTIVRKLPDGTLWPAVLPERRAAGRRALTSYPPPK